MSEFKDISILFESASKGMFKYPKPDGFWVEASSSSDLQTAFEAAARHTSVFLVSDRVSINFQYGRLTYKFSRDHTRVENVPYVLGERIGLDTSSLRRAFTFLEYTIFLLCKYPRNENDPYYVEQSEGYWDRVKLLQEHGKLSTEVGSKLKAIKNTRDQFAHSFIEIDDLAYRGGQLKYVKREFLSDLNSVVQSLEQMFVENQNKQVDWRLFSVVFNALQKARGE